MSKVRSIFLDESKWDDWGNHAQKHLSFYQTVHPFGRTWKNDDGTRIVNRTPKVCKPLVFQGIVGDKEFESVWCPWFKKRPWQEDAHYSTQAMEVAEQGDLAFARQMAYLVQRWAEATNQHDRRFADKRMFNTVEEFGKSIHDEWKSKAKDWPTPLVVRPDQIIWVPLGVFHPEWNSVPLGGLDASEVFFTGFPGETKGTGLITPMMPHTVFRRFFNKDLREWDRGDVWEKCGAIHAQWEDRLEFDQSMYSSATWVDLPHTAVQKLGVLHQRQYAFSKDDLLKVEAMAPKEALPSSWWCSPFSSKVSAQTLKFGKELAFGLKVREKDMKLTSFWSYHVRFDPTGEYGKVVESVGQAVQQGRAIDPSQLHLWKSALDVAAKDKRWWTSAGSHLFDQLVSEVERLSLRQHVRKKLSKDTTLVSSMVL
jgi:hypothetical protein